MEDTESTNTILSTSARTEADCRTIWALANSCSCSWGNNSRIRGGAKRKTAKILKSGLIDCDNFSARRKVVFGEDKGLFYI